MIVGIGIDVVAVDRLRRWIHRRPEALARWFHPDELDGLGTGAAYWDRLAARFAAKEALIKACGGLRGGRLRDICLMRRMAQGPALRVEGALGEWLRRGRLVAWVSISHERGLAAAMVVLEQRLNEEDGHGVAG